LIENRHNPTTVHLRTLVAARFKMTVYRDAAYGDLFDLQADPGELHNCWNDPAYAAVQARLLLQFVQAEIQREPTRMPRSRVPGIVAHLKPAEASTPTRHVGQAPT
jgi:hypothetical protein